MKNPHTPNLTWIGSWWPEIRPHEYLISPIESGLVHNCLEPGQFTLISMGLIRYSCGHISGPHEPIPTQFFLWMFFIMLHWYIISKTQKSKKFFVTSSLLYSICGVQSVYVKILLTLLSALTKNYLSMHYWSKVSEKRYSCNWICAQYVI